MFRGVLAAVVALLLFAAPKAFAAPTGLTVEHQAKPLAVEAQTPLLGWQVGEGVQTAYQVKIGTTPSTLGDVYDSGQVAGDASQNVAGPQLASSTRFYWTVRTWDAKGDATDYAQTAQFGTKATWTATPIWAPAPSASLGSDYDVEGDFKVTTVAAGIKFRVNGTNSFYWQIRGDSSNELRPHVQVNGTYTQLKAVKLPMTIGLNTQHHIRIHAEGSTITTYIDGTLVDTTVDTRNPNGSIGFRHGSTESDVWDNIKVTDLTGKTLYSNDFSIANTDFPCGTVANGVLTVGTAKDCSYGLTDNWAFLRKTFKTQDKAIAGATLYASARSTEPAHQYVYKLSVNGSFVGVGPTRAIRNTTETMYNAYDVTALLQRNADNAIGALAYTTTDKRFIAQLNITYADGSTDVVNSDGTWTSFAGERAIPAGASIGTGSYAAPAENIDARKYPFGYDTAAFDDSAWDAATTKAAMPGLTGTPQANLVQRLREPVKVIKTGDKHYFLDFGRTVVGGLQLQFNATGGEQVEIRLGETQSGNVVKYQMTTGNVYRDTWTLKPGEQTLSLWGYRVFRYAEVIGADPTDFKAASIIYPYDAGASSWNSDDSALNTVLNFNRDGTREIEYDLHMDSGTRERAPYEGDNLINMLIQGYDDGDWTASKYTLQWLAVNETWPAEWRFASILSAYEYWKATGDIDAIRPVWEDLKAFSPSKWIRASDGLVEKAPGSSSSTNADLVDWPAGERDNYVFTTVNTVINAWSYRALADLAELATALGGNDADAATWNAQATRLRAAINQYLYDPASGAYNDGLTTTHKAVHASVFAVSMGVATPAQAQSAAAYIAQRGMVCSVFCANFLVDALYTGGRPNDAVAMFDGTGQRSWLHMIEQGAGSPMEGWDPALKSNTSYSHPWAGSPAYLVYRGTLGIEPIDPGYKSFSVKPQLGTLGHAEGTTPTQYGTIGVAAASNGDALVKVPANTTAVVTLPGKAAQTVGAGCHLFADGTAAQSVIDFAHVQGCVWSTSVDGAVGGTVPATLSLTLGAPASFGAFLPGVARTYETSTTANVISTAGDAALTVSTATLRNGAFSLNQPLQTTITPASWSQPVSNAPVDIGFRQRIEATDALRTGTYSATLTFTLSTTSP